MYLAVCLWYAIMQALLKNITNLSQAFFISAIYQSYQTVLTENMLKQLLNIQMIYQFLVNPKVAQSARDHTS